MYETIGYGARFPSGISREQFEPICPLLESARKKTALRKVDRLVVVLRFEEQAANI
jgi:hypothetical protein